VTDAFSIRLLRWYDTHGRTDLPWQHPRTPYRVWLSEIMLQQTQVSTVLPYFLRFVEKFATLPALAAAPLDDVLALWSGLGYYSRARNLHRAAQLCVAQHGGELPRDYDALAALPGIGRSTAGAILAQAHGLRLPILDGNVKRVLARFHAVDGWPGTSAVAQRLWKCAEMHTPHERLADYTQAIMDLGATLCTRAKPRCAQCPLHEDCAAFRDGSTARLPARKPPRTVPTRATVMLLLRDAGGRILLQRRPPTGVWAQLWSFPQTDDVEGARHLLARDAAGAAAIALRPLPPFTHAFSHYRLAITPFAVDIARPRRIADAAQERWLLPAEAAALGLPAPVRKLIESFSEET
jgi:A/G-specific adenine glycosylase